jgi:prepilin-type N-terminal cleavage/methylation domain-containing protein
MKINHKKAFSLIELSIVILIIGILVAGVTQSSRLISQFRLSSARSITKSSPVTSIKDLALWLESTSENSFDDSDQEDGLPVDNWYDINPQTISKINFTQGVANQRPLYESNAINNLPALYFDGSNDSLTLANTLTLQEVTDTNQATIFVVHKMLNVRDTNNFTIFTTANSAIRINSHFPGVGNSIYYFDFGTCCTEGVGRMTNTGFPASFFNRTNIVTWHKRPTTGTIRVNGAQMVSNTLTGSFDGSNLGSNMTFLIGSGNDVSAYFLGGYLAELIMFKRGLRADEITDIERYLSKKWGIKI